MPHPQASPEIGDPSTPRSWPAIEELFERSYGPAIDRVSDAADLSPSPDGRAVAFTATVWHKLEGRPSTHIAVADIVAGTLRVSRYPGNDRLPRWAPDGDRLAFLSDRSSVGSHQLFLAPATDVDQAEAPPAVEGTVEYFSWSPDGRVILLGVAEPGADLAGVHGSGTTGGVAGDTNAWRPRIAGSTPSESWRSAWLLQLETMSLTRLSRPGLNIWESAWLGTGQVAAIASDSPGEHAWYRAWLALLDASTGDERVVFRSPLQLGVLAGSTSGARVAVVEARCSDRSVVAGQVLLIDPESAAVSRVDTLGVDVTSLAWARDDRLWYAGLRGLETVVGQLGFPGPTTREEWASNETCGVIYPEAVPLPGRGAVIVVHGYRRYPELAAVEGGTLRPLIQFAHEGTDYQLGLRGSIREVSWLAADGLEIQGLLCLPSNGGPHPLVVHIHGGPVYAFRNTWGLMIGAPDLVSGLVSRGFAVLNVNPRGSSGRGPAFADHVYGDPGGADAQDILWGIDRLIAEGIVDPRRIGLTGRSYGGFMSAWLVTQTDRFAASVPRAPVTNWYSFHNTTNVPALTPLLIGADPRAAEAFLGRSPVTHAHRVTTPVLVMAGALDRCAPPTQAVEFHHALVECGVDASLVIYPEEGHHVLRYEARIDELARIVDFFEQHMSPA